MNELGKISIIVPYYRTEYYKVKYCIDSLICQSYKDIEILVVDDGSGNEFSGILKKVEDMDSRIRIEHLEKNSGLSAARNYGLSVCRGDYVLFVDSDDMLNHNTVEDLFMALKKTKADMAIGELVVVNNYMMTDDEGPCRENIEYFNTLETLENLVVSKKFGSTACGRLARKEIWYPDETVPFIEGILHEDLASMWKVISGCDSVCWVRGNYYCYYQGANSGIHTKSISVKFCIDFINALEYRNKSLLKKYRELETAIAFSYLVNCPLIYTYICMLDTNTEKEKLKTRVKELFYKNLKRGMRYAPIEKKQNIKILLFRFNPNIYGLIYKIIRKVKGMRY